jgi:hypothetical protein
MLQCILALQNSDLNTARIWEDPWFPRDFSRRPITPRGACLLTFVVELINPITGSWDEELIKYIFWEEDSDIILSLPILQGNENRLIWHFDKRGQFSVRKLAVLSSGLTAGMMDRVAVQ